ncbi:HPr family phosphocarrier protein [Salinibacterium sp. SYSU T00001]|uniref:HPr family phosphocarrier protein n=1 Tax=Homoserinimonas sedimenticola TaxID=2986805 RepID=UPI0022363447|nr:HPr family phosphocarrier protein [Salinibacterium sedimenticola]MCW4385121.1 HPr family phosphocarrier protein [Salinibacterium sedimenticola]
MAEAQRTVQFGSAVGLHARPAATIAKAAAESGHTVTLEAANGKKANAASVLLLLAMGVNKGDELTVTVSGDDADATADRLAELIGSELDPE